MATKTFNTRIANKRDTSANWTSNNPVLLNGEVIIVDTEAGQVRYKVGNGTSTYTQLPFTDESLITNINGKLSLSGGTMTGNIDMGGHKLTGLGAPVNPNDAVRQTDLKVVSDEVDGIISGTTGITLAPATTTKIGGIIVGDGIEVEADGTISTNPVPSGGTPGQVLTKTSTGEEWANAPSGLPEGGTEGQMLYKSLNGTEWGDKPNIYVNIEYSDGSYSADKTYEEIRQLLLDGFHVFARYGGLIFVLSSCLLESTISSIKFFNAKYKSYRALSGSFFEIEPDSSVSNNSFVLDFSDYVPVTRSINGNRLSQDVHLSAEDVNAIENPANGTAGQVLTKTADGSAWENAPSGLPEGGTEGQMLYKTANGAEWGMPPYLGSMPQLDYSQMKSLHALGITDLNDVTEPGTYVGMNGASYPNIANLPSAVAELDIPFVLNVYSLTGPSGTDYAGYTGIFQNLFCIADTYAGHIRNFWRGGMSSGTGGVTFPFAWDLETDANNISFTPTSTLTSENVQDAIEEVDTQLSTKLTTPTGTQGQYLGFTADNTVGAVDAPESGLTQEQADERYLQLTGGTIEVDALSTALTLKNTKSTGAVSDVNTSPYLNFETGNGKVVNEYIDFGSGHAAVTFYDVENDDFVTIAGLLDPVDGADAANKAYVDSKAPTSVTITLTTSGWSSNTQTVTVSGVSASETAQLIAPTPAIASQSAYYEAGIMCTNQGTNSLTFTCQTVPTSNLTVYVVIQPLG